jgi:hypothetical protein
MLAKDETGRKASDSAMNIGGGMTKDPNQRQVDRGIKKGQSQLPDRSGRLTGHTKQPLKGEPVEEPSPDKRTVGSIKPKSG